MEQSSKWYKNNPEVKGEWVFSFDKKTEFNMFRDYPHALTSEQKKIFDDENPYWKEFFKDRTQLLKLLGNRVFLLCPK